MRNMVPGAFGGAAPTGAIEGNVTLRGHSKQSEKLGKKGGVAGDTCTVFPRFLHEGPTDLRDLRCVRERRGCATHPYTHGKLRLGRCRENAFFRQKSIKGHTQP